MRPVAGVDQETPFTRRTVHRLRARFTIRTAMRVTSAVIAHSIRAEFSCEGLLPP